jgi:malonyl-CoA/methylmalonyl-CoA synthetase
MTEGMTLGKSFDLTFSRFPERPAVTFCRKGAIETEMTFGALSRLINRAAVNFKDMGIIKGDRVILFLPKSLFFMIAHLGLQKIGAISIPLNTGFKKGEMEYFIRDSAPTLIIAGREQEPLARDTAQGIKTIVVDTDMPFDADSLFPEATEEDPGTAISPHDPALIIYTSGTTGMPKGAVLTHGNLVSDARHIIEIWEINEADVLCHALPLFHVHGLCFALHTCLLAGAHVILLDAFSPEKVVEILSDGIGGRSCTVFMAVPSMYARMMELAEGRDFSHMRLFTSGSAPLLPKDFHRIRQVFGKEPVEREGMSETGMNFSNPIRGVRKPGSIGIPLPELEVRIVNPETFQDVPKGSVGEIWLKGPCVSPGYWRKPEENKKAFVDGWFRTGDLGRTDEDGYYYLTDRLKHIIISGGENISPKEVEAVINRMEGVVESSVVGVPDEKWGERVVAAVVPSKRHEISGQAIMAHCREHLHPWKCPKEIRFVEALPRNAMGKVLKKEVEGLFI